MATNEIEEAIEKAFTKERVVNRDRRFTHPPYVLESRLRACIVEGDLTAAKEALKAINRNERARLAGDKLRSLKNSLIGSCTIYTRAAIDGSVDAELAFTLSDTFIRRIEACPDEEALLHLEFAMLREFTELVRRYRDQGHDVLVTRALRIVHAELMGKPTLASIARKLGVDPHYLSGRFSRKMGVTLVSYVKRAKAEEAKTFLRSTSLKIGEIADNLGFSSQAYFCRVFKEATGKSPREYRNRNSSN